MEPHKIISEYISSHRKFYLSDVIEQTNLKRRIALRILDKFRKDGYLQELKDEKTYLRLNEFGPRRRNPQFKRIKDIMYREREWAPCQRDKIWKTMRYLRRATRSELIRITGCEKTVEDYTRILALHGYIRCIGRRSKEKVWFLVKDVGPRRPRISEKVKNDA